MEELGDILKRLATRQVSEDGVGGDIREPGEQGEPCQLCGGRGWTTPDVAVGHPEFGTAVVCECQKQRVGEEQQARLTRYSNLGFLTRFTFDTLMREGLSEDPENRELFGEACRAAEEYAKDPSGWLVLVGPHGSGKTHLAAAIGNRCIEQGHVVFFSHVPDLLDHLRATFSPTSEMEYSDLFEQVRNSPLLILDDLIAETRTRE